MNHALLRLCGGTASIVACTLWLAACGGGDAGQVQANVAPTAAPTAAATAATAITSPATTASTPTVRAAAVTATNAGREQLSALAPLASNTTTTLRDATRLADQATFGATEALISALQGQGVEPWLTAQFVATGSSYARGESDLIHKAHNGDFCAARGSNCWRDWYSTDPLLWDFYRNAIGQPDQLRQRVAYALGQIVVVSAVEVSGTYGFRNYHNALLANAFGNYREVLRKVARSPLMGDYLDHVNNDKLAPNENFSRELLQLFSVGTCRLNPDGSLETGRCAPVYTNEIVRAYAFALTGWTYPAGGTSIYTCWPTGANCTYYTGDMAERLAGSDNQARVLLSGITVPAIRTPTQALNQVLDSLMLHPSMAPFIGKQLIQHLVKSNPSPAYVQRVATAFRTGVYVGNTRSFGSAVNGDLTATVAAILLDTEARNSAPPLVAERLREPALVMAGTLRALNGFSDGAALGWWWGEAFRQHMFRSPSVFNHYPPNYPVAGTRLVGPAFGIYNANTAFSRLNYVNQLIYWGGMGIDSTVPGATGSQVSLAAFETSADNATALVDRLANLATGGRMTASTRANIVSAVAVWDASKSANWRAERVRAAAYLVFSAPAYQVMN